MLSHWRMWLYADTIQGKGASRGAFRIGEGERPAVGASLSSNLLIRAEVRKVFWEGPSEEHMHQAAGHTLCQNSNPAKQPSTMGKLLCACAAEKLCL